MLSRRRWGCRSQGRSRPWVASCCETRSNGSGVQASQLARRHSRTLWCPSRTSGGGAALLQARAFPALTRSLTLRRRSLPRARAWSRTRSWTRLAGRGSSAGGLRLRASTVWWLRSTTALPCCGRLMTLRVKSLVQITPRQNLAEPASCWCGETLRGSRLRPVPLVESMLALRSTAGRLRRTLLQRLPACSGQAASSSSQLSGHAVRYMLTARTELTASGRKKSCAL
mmetsp:Transcript_136795/g.381330  ORF Transcript_136795/g.381330 Transcript_136795/m.381330 type:complete len:227 (+) Transcript_136795:613-1293(+)